MGATNNNISLKELEVFFKNNGIETQSLIYTYEQQFNSVFWKKYFVKSATPVPLQSDGTGLFQMASMSTTPDILFQPRTDWSEMEESPKDGFNTYQGSIAAYGRKYKWTPKQLSDFERALKAAGGNTVVEAAYMKKVFDLMKGAHATVSNLSAQILSKGQYISVNEKGFKTQGKAEVPTARIIKAGAKVWSDATADIIGKMQATEKALRDATGYTGMLSWKMNKTTFNYVMNNTAVQGFLKGYNAAKIGLISSSDMPAIIGTVQNYNEWVGAISLDYLSVIEIVEESQTNLTGQLVKTVVHGWEDGRAVLSPMGLQGEIKYAAIEELNWIDPIMCQLAYSEGGLFSIANYKINSGAFSDYHTQMYLHLAPALAVFDKMYIVDTKTAD